ncbi:integral membrane protein, TerC family [Chelatococcus sambhunathii]|uniref:Integral membrane protein, TerC family n=1 Tax=Chelatococcus sambhunathii TaxID=363953 RepID=A0ABM9UBT3_9HYPH|nr:TerC family protein [Chelatococcus sambhunathii]CUA91036.1 integral membrane protein, TerC family [Chelatococcus sambhunathii]
MDVLTSFFLGHPLWMWLGFMGLVMALLALDLGVLHRGSREIGVRESLALSAFYIVLGLGFGGFVWWQLGTQASVEYITGFVVEKSLAMDNIFVIAMIFGFFAIPRRYQHRVLFWGILGVIVLRAIMIGFGAALVAQYEWVLYLFAAFLIVTGLKMLWWGDQETDLAQNPLLRLIKRRFRVTRRLHGERFFVRRRSGNGRSILFLTPLFLALVFIEIADIIFAVDSVPAIFAITTDPYIVYTSNIFAILGLRALYFALAAVLHRFAYLKQALAVLLVFIGSKVFVADLFGWAKFPAEWSLAVTFAILGAGIGWSLWKTRDEGHAGEGQKALSH